MSCLFDQSALAFDRDLLRTRGLSITRIHGSGALGWNADHSFLCTSIFVAQAHQLLGIDETVICDLQDQLQQVTAAHEAAHEALQAIHQEMDHIRNQAGPRARTRLVEPKSLMPDRFGKKSGSSWRKRSYLAKDIAGVAHPTLKQAMKNSENRKQPIPEQDIQDFGPTTEIGHELQKF